MACDLVNRGFAGKTTPIPILGGIMKHQTILNRVGKVGVALAMAASVVMGTTACDSDDARVIGGTIAIVAGAIAIDSATDRCHGGYRTVCRSTRDRWGRVHRDCDQVWDSCARRYDAGIALDVNSPLYQDVAVSQLAEKYALPVESAARLNDLLQQAAKGEASAMEALGLQGDDLKRVARYQLPSKEALEKVAAVLAISRSMAEDLVNKIMNETKLQMADVTSPTWTACMKSGKWKTDANGGTCKSTSWMGCSPETGASVCVPR